MISWKYLNYVRYKFNLFYSWTKYGNKFYNNEIIHLHSCCLVSSWRQSDKSAWVSAFEWVKRLYQSSQALLLISMGDNWYVLLHLLCYDTVSTVYNRNANVARHLDPSNQPNDTRPLDSTYKNNQTSKSSWYTIQLTSSQISQFFQVGIDTIILSN